MIMKTFIYFSFEYKLSNNFNVEFIFDFNCSKKLNYGKNLLKQQNSFAGN